MIDRLARGIGFMLVICAVLISLTVMAAVAAGLIVYLLSLFVQ